MKYVVWGCGIRGVWLKNQIESGHRGRVMSFADNDLGKIGKRVEDIPVISMWRLKKEYADCRVVIPGTFGEVEVKRIVEHLSDTINKENIFVVPSNNILNKEKRVITIDDFELYEHWAQIDTLGIKLANHCNLNCVRCNNFSNISPHGCYL